MASISLRSYNREIGSLIDSGQIDEAVAHCRHILKTYPKHVDTYRLLGKAYLEGERYGDAIDVLQRILSSVPDDFISHLGMSIIREEEGNLDQAIWHMERAFEIQPANSAIQDELRRLYGRRDGVEPPKIRLTRGALARMYVKGDLYQQAVAELRAALAEDAQRIDLQVLLARACSLSGQRIEAAEISSELLKKLPYCLEANQIMVEVLASSDRAADAGPYRQRLQALDPYSAFITSANRESSTVPEETIILEKLEWDPGMAASGRSPQVEWASSMGVALVDFSSSQVPIPDWLGSAEGTSAEGPSPAETPISEKMGAGEEPAETVKERSGKTPSPPSAWEGLSQNARTPAGPGDEEPAAQPTPAEEIPEWMKAAGWGLPSGTAEEPAAASTPEADDLILGPMAEAGELAEAEIPDWLKAMAPTPDDETQGDQEGFSWLNDILNKAESETVPEKKPEEAETLSEAATQPADAEEEPAADATLAEELPDWFNEADFEKPAGQAEALPADSEETRVEAFSSDWIWKSSEEEEIVTPEPETESSELDWLRELEGELAVEGDTEPVQTGQSTQPAAVPSVEPESEPAGDTGEAGKTPAEGIPDWLLETPAETTPDWMQETVSSSPPGSGALVWPEIDMQGEEDLEPEETGKAVETPGEVLAQEPAVEAPAEGSLEAELPEWLRSVEEPAVSGQAVEASVEGEAGVPEPEMETPAEGSLEAELPEWLRSVEEPAVTEQTVETPAEGKVSLQEPALEAPAEGSLEAELPEWLRSVEEPAVTEQTVEASVEGEAGVPEPEMEAPAEGSLEAELPEWLRSVEEPAVSGQAAEMPAESDVTILAPAAAAAAASLDERLKELGGPLIEGDTKPVRVKGAQVFEAAPAEAGAAQPEPPAAAPDLQAETPAEPVPDWLQETVVASQSDIQAEIEAQPEEEAHPEPETPEMAQPEQAAAEEQPAPAETPGWPAEVQETPAGAEFEPAAGALLAGIGALAFPVEETLPEEGVSEEAVPEQAASEDVERELAFDLGDTEASYAWLESLAAKQAEEQEQPPAAEEASEAIPDWMQETVVSAQQQPVEQPVEAGAPVEPESQLEVEAPAELQAEAQPEEMQPPVEVESGLEPAGTAPLEPREELAPAEAELEAPAPVESQPVPEAAVTGMEEEQIPELPDWLAEETAEKAEAEEEWTPTEVTLPAAPHYPLDLNKASLTELERLPGIGFIMAQQIIDYRERSGPFTSLEDLGQVPGLDESIVEDMRGYLNVQAPQEAVAPALEEDESQMELIAARNALIQGSIEQAVDRYTSLVKSRQFLDEVIRELREATFRYPVEASIWQTLGDAYLRTDQLQEALDAYNKAEELLS